MSSLPQDCEMELVRDIITRESIAVPCSTIAAFSTQ